MLNIIWVGIIVLSAIFGLLNGTIDEVVNAIPEKAVDGFQLALTLGGGMVFWLGIMNIAEKSGVISGLSRLLRPFMRIIFPGVPEDHPAMSSIVMNISANMFGLANAATPFGLKAMKQLNELNVDKGKASDEMCMFLAVNTSSVQLIPLSSILILQKNGGIESSNIVTTSLLATLCSTIAAIGVCVLFRWLGAKWRSIRPNGKVLS